MKESEYIRVRNIAHLSSAWRSLSEVFSCEELPKEKLSEITEIVYQAMQAGLSKVETLEDK